MDLKIGARISLKNTFIERFIDKSELSSKAFGIVAITDVAVAVRNLRSGRMYTLPIGEVAKNVEEEPKSSSPAAKQTPPVVLDLPFIKRPSKPIPFAAANFTAPEIPVKFAFARVSAKTSVVKAGDLFSYLYNEN